MMISEVLISGVQYFAPKAAMVSGTADEFHDDPAPVCARVSASFGMPARRYMLLNPLMAREETPLHSLANMICCLENLSHVLCWAELDSKDDIM